MDQSISRATNRFQPVKKFRIFCGTQRFVTAFTHACHLSLSSASSIQYIPPYPTSWRYIFIFSSYLCLGVPCGLFSAGFPNKTLYTPLLSPIRATCPVHLILLDLITRTILGEEYRLLSSSLCSFLHSPVTSPLFTPKYFPQHPILKQHQTHLKCIGPYIILITEEQNPTRCHLLLYYAYVRLNVFRAPLCPSSEDHDDSIGYHIGRLFLELLLVGS